MCWFVAVELVLRGVKQESGCGGINPSIGITNSVEGLSRTVVRNDVNNNVQDASNLQGPAKKYCLGEGELLGGGSSACMELSGKVFHAVRNARFVWSL